MPQPPKSCPYGGALAAFGGAFGLLVVTNTGAIDSTHEGTGGSFNDAYSGLLIDGRCS